MTQLEEIQKALKSVQDAQAAAEANFDPMKGRTYIPRMSPAMKKMIIDAIAKKGDRGDRDERKEARLIDNKRKKRLRKFITRKQDREGMEKATPTPPTQIENPSLKKEPILYPSREDLAFMLKNRPLRF